MENMFWGHTVIYVGAGKRAGEYFFFFVMCSVDECIEVPMRVNLITPSIRDFNCFFFLT